MPPKNPFSLYLRSRLSLTLALGAAVLAVLAVAFLREHSLAPVIVVIIVYAGVTTAVFFSRRGAREIVRESEQDRLARTRARTAEVERVRERISVLRLGNERLARAIEYFLQEYRLIPRKMPRAFQLFAPGKRKDREGARDMPGLPR